jgi:hypothetical protein
MIILRLSILCFYTFIEKMELSIKAEHFTSKFLYINNNNTNNTFFPISYRTPTLTLNNLLFETPWMEAPFGICQYNNEKDKLEGKYYLDLSFNGYLYDMELKNFYKVIDNIDNFVINFINNYYEYYDKYPKKNKKNKTSLSTSISTSISTSTSQGSVKDDIISCNSDDEINQLNSLTNSDNSDDQFDNYEFTYNYNRQIRFNKNNNKFPPTMKLKIFDNFTNIMDIYGNRIHNFAEYIKPNAKAQALIRCNGLWMYDNKWGLSWKVCKIIIKNNDEIVSKNKN